MSSQFRKYLAAGSLVFVLAACAGVALASGGGESSADDQVATTETTAPRDEATVEKSEKSEKPRHHRRYHRKHRKQVHAAQTSTPVQTQAAADDDDEPAATPAPTATQAP